MSSSLAGKTAIVTGAGSGMGRATVLALLDAGANVIAGDVNTTALESLPSSQQLELRRCNVASPEDARGLVDAALQTFGSLHIVCNSAGISQPETIVEAGEIWQRTLDINLNGVLNVTKFAIPAIKDAGGGSIINWASGSAFTASPNMAAYCVSKAAVLMLTKCIAVDHAADGIRANAICPGWVDTPMAGGLVEAYGSREVWMESVAKVQPLGLGTPESIADVAVFLASDASRHMTGSAVMVDGGASAQTSSVRPS